MKSGVLAIVTPGEGEIRDGFSKRWSVVERGCGEGNTSGESPKKVTQRAANLVQGNQRGMLTGGFELKKQGSPAGKKKKWSPHMFDVDLDVGRG